MFMYNSILLVTPMIFASQGMTQNT